MTDELGFTLSVIGLYAALRYTLGQTGRRWLALAATVLVLAAVAFLVLGLATGARAAGMLFVCAVVDAAWIAFGRRPLNVR